MLHPILVVHRQQVTREKVVKALDEAGFVGIPASTGHAVLEYLQSGGTATVILREDTHDEGWTRFARVQRRDSRLARIPVIALSPLHQRDVYTRHDESVDVSPLIVIVKHLCAVKPPFGDLRGLRARLVLSGSGAIN